MTTQREREILERFAEQVKAREQELPKELRLERKGRVRNKYRLLEKWKAVLEEYSGPGTAELVAGYRPSGIQASVDVGEIAGLIVRDEDGVTHHLRLYRNESAAFIEIPDDSDARIRIDPMKKLDVKHYQRDGVPTAVTEVLDALEVTPGWDDACADGEHTFTISGEKTRSEAVICETCGSSQAVLSWLGHTVPTKDELER